MTWRVAACAGLFSLLIGVKPSVAVDGLLTFDTMPPGPLPRGGVYTESGMEVRSFSDFSSLGDPLGAGVGGQWLYFHGTNQYVEFRLVNGSAFDLVSFDAGTNAYTEQIARINHLVDGTSHCRTCRPSRITNLGPSARGGRSRCQGSPSSSRACVRVSRGRTSGAAAVE